MNISPCYPYPKSLPSGDGRAGGDKDSKKTGKRVALRGKDLRQTA